MSASCRAEVPAARRGGFSLIELLVALAVFAALAAAAYGGLAEIARARGALAERQDRFADVMRAVSAIERDLRQAVSRPVRGNERAAIVPALAGAADRIELSRLGFANPLAEARSHIERVAYVLDGHALRRARYAVLDRAPATTPNASLLLDDVESLRLRYAGTDGAWRDEWPPKDLPPSSAVQNTTDLLPRAIEVRIVLDGLGEIRRVVLLPSSFPDAAVEASP